MYVPDIILNIERKKKEIRKNHNTLGELINIIRVHGLWEKYNREIRNEFIINNYNAIENISYRSRRNISRNSSKAKGIYNRKRDKNKIK